MVNLARELVSRGHQVDIVLARSPQPNSYDPGPGINVIWLRKDSILKLIPSLARLLRVKRYDAMFTGMPTSNIALLVARTLSLSRTPIVISERSNPFLEAKNSRTWRYRAAFRLQRYIYPLADEIIAVSTDLADALAKSAHIDRNKIKVIFNPAFDERAPLFEAAPPHRWLDDNSTPLIVGAGRFRPQKDFSTFLKVIAQVAAERPVRAILLGDGEESEALQQQAAELGIAERVLFPGFVSDVGPWLRGADTFLMTSLWEGFGNILVQALAARCSVVSTDCPDGPSEILGNGRFGLLAPVGDVEALTQAVLTVLEQPFEPQAQYDRACDFTVVRSTDQYESLFRDLVAKANK